MQLLPAGKAAFLPGHGVAKCDAFREQPQRVPDLVTASCQCFAPGAPAYLQRHGAPDSLGELTNHRCSAFRNSSTGKILPWYVKVDESLVDLPVVPALCLNDETIETEAVLAGHVIGLLTGVAATSHIRAGRLVPLLTQHIADRSSVFVYYGSRVSQPSRVRAFIELAIEKLTNNPDYVMAAAELAAAEKSGRRQYLLKR